MTAWQQFVKRSFDVIMAAFGLVVCGWLIIICWIIATIDTRQNGFFTQQRVGKNGQLFMIIKIRTMRPIEGVNAVFTMRNDPRITHIGKVLRRFKLDELPQLINVLFGQMSFVGPRPDVAGFADMLQGEDRIILSVRPGITGYATLAFRNEEELLALSDDPERYNSEVIFPTKVKMNRYYIENYSFHKDILYIIATVVPSLKDRVLSILEPV
jgi:lipopolysaccharide/colanic/teichoic acid biosynthesis glycosyltransferase